MKLCVVLVSLWTVTSVTLAQNPSDRSHAIDFSLTDEVPAQGMLLDSIQLQFNHKSDSLKHSYAGKFQKLDSVRTGLQHKIDTLASSNILKSNLTNAIDSINRLRQKTISTLNEKLQSLKEHTIGKIKKLNLPPELNEKVSALTKDIEGFSIQDLPGISDLNISQAPLGGITDLNVQSLSDVGKIDELKNVSGSISDVSEVTGEIGVYRQQTQQLSQGSMEAVKELPSVAEEKAAELSGLKNMQKEASVLDDYKDKMGQIQDPVSTENQGVEKLQQAAMDHFAGKGEVLQEAMDKMAKYKEKYESLNGLSDITKKRPNEMRGKPLMERIVPAFMIQIQKEGNDLLLDLNPYIGYRFTGKITAGPGWNQRIAYNTHANTFNSNPRIFGPRVFAEYDLWKGFHPRVEVEIMNSYVPPLTQPATIDLGNRQWVWGMFLGIKKEYRFLKTVKGTALIMTRLFDPHHKSPYADVINARFGFEFPMKKKMKTN